MRYPPIPETDWTSEQRDLARAITAGPRGQLRGPFVPLMHAPELADKVQALGDLLRFRSGIPKPLIEIATCMTARARECPYIWGSHSKAAIKAGVAPALLAAISQRERPAVMSDDETLIHDFCDQLLNAEKVSDQTFEAVAARWGRPGALEIAGLCGYYSLLACILIAADLQQAPGTDPFAVERT